MGMTQDKLHLNDMALMVEGASMDAALSPRHEADVLQEANKLSNRTVGGFSFIDPRWVEEQVQNARETREHNVKSFRERRAALIEKLAGFSIKPLAVLPAKYWDEITQQHGLVTLCPNMDGKVRVSRDVSHRVGAAAGNMGDTLAGIFMSVGVLATLALALMNMVSADSVVGFMYICLTSPLFVAAMAFTIFGTVGIYKMRDWRVQYVLKNWIKTHTRAQLIQAVTARYDDYSYHTAMLRLPDPPADVIELLRKLRSANLAFEVTAEVDAVCLNPSPEQLFCEGYKIREEQLRTERADPIIVVREHDHNGNPTGVVAILAQFGDFAWEKKVVDEVVWSRPLP
jgi:hypothetical protein